MSHTSSPTGAPLTSLPTSGAGHVGTPSRATFSRAAIAALALALVVAVTVVTGPNARAQGPDGGGLATGSTDTTSTDTTSTVNPADPADAANQAAQASWLAGVLDELAARDLWLATAVDATETKLAEARRLAAEAEAQVASTRAAVVALDKAIAANEARVAELTRRAQAAAVRTYMGGTVEGAGAVVAADTGSGVATRHMLVGVVVGQLSDLRRDLAVARTNLDADKTHRAALLAEQTQAVATAATSVSDLAVLQAQLVTQRNELTAAVAAFTGHAAATNSSDPFGVLEANSIDGDLVASSLAWPAGGVLTSPFGLRWGVLHAGIDIGAVTGTPVTAAAGGTVTFAGPAGGYGNLVVVNHGSGVATAYGHQSRLAVVVGQTVAPGTVLGAVGSTGQSTGPHLHFEVRVGTRPIDPLSVLDARTRR